MRVLALATALLLSGCANPLDAQVRSIHDLKVRDAKNDYEKAAAPLDRCVKAKLVALAYEDAKDAASTSVWHARETADCEAAMIALGVDPSARPAD